MATILLSAAGAALGGIAGGGAFGLSSVVIGRAIGATVGRLVDQRLMGGGSEVVETARMDRLRIMGAREGVGVARVFGRMRVAGNVIWASDFKEHVTVSGGGGGKGGPKPPQTRSYSYTVSVAIGLCEGEIASVGRVWADGAEIAPGDLNLRIYKGREDQSPDPVMEAIEGAGNVPAYRGMAYVVLEDLDLSQFGNRVPQMSFEVVRPAQIEAEGALAETVQAVALMPGSGEAALEAEENFSRDSSGLDVAVNVNSTRGKPDISVALDALQDELPNCKATSLVVSWFGDDLRAGHCVVQPKAENLSQSGAGLGSAPVVSTAGDNWTVSGANRNVTGAVSRIDDRPVYGGTPSDISVVSAIRAAREAGQHVMFYPFILMDVLPDNTLPDPWSSAVGQPAFPWRGRITTEAAPGELGSTDGTAAARSEVDAFMGTASVGDFSLSGDSVVYSGSPDWGYRRFILHYAHLCKAADGVGSFCIGSELRALTQIRDETGAFPAVEALQLLANEVRSILGSETKIGYAADWTEYFGYHPQDGSGDVLFHLDPLWADSAIDFIGIDNYMPISDWRDGETHLDRGQARSIYDLSYLKGNIAGGEGFDWYYGDAQDRDDQLRSDITDGAHGEPWVYRYKDLHNWWSMPHHNRVGGVRSSTPTAWTPMAKPFWFTELGCAAIDKATNQPNKFLDPKSSESALPHYSNGRRDDYMQMQYLRAYHEFFGDVANNPVSTSYSGPMVDQERMFVWAWDTRPWPEFPNNRELWSDGGNHARGHWLTGRSGGQRLSDVVRDICAIAGVHDVDVSALSGVVHGFSLPDVETARASLQQLMLAYGVDAVEDRGKIVFIGRDLAEEVDVTPAHMVVRAEDDDVLQHVRAPDAETTGQVRLSYTEAEGGFEDRVAEARFPGDGTDDLTQTEVSLAMTAQEARGVSERWLSEARVARESVKFSLPPSCREVRAGTLVRLTEENETPVLYRVDRLEDAGAIEVEAVRVERQIYTPSDAVEELPGLRASAAPVRIAAQFMDLPILTGEEVPHAPHVAAVANPWPGGAAVYGAPQDAGYALNTVVEIPAVMGFTETVLPRGAPGLWQRGAVLRVKLARGDLSSVDPGEVLAGRNVAAIGDGSSSNWEIVQFAEATLVAADTYELSGFLRGQVGSDGLMPDAWPAGSRFVLLDGAVTQIGLEAAMRGLERHYRIGPAARPVDDAAYQHFVEAFDGIGLKPYAPVHLKARAVAGDMTLSWVRRTRIDGDSWSSIEVPLGEESESYLVRILNGETLVREVSVSTPSWTYLAADQVADGVTSGFGVEVAQVSARFGAGHFARIEIDG